MNELGLISLSQKITYIKVDHARYRRIQTAMSGILRGYILPGGALGSCYANLPGDRNK